MDTLRHIFFIRYADIPFHFHRWYSCLTLPAWPESWAGMCQSGTDGQVERVDWQPGAKHVRPLQIMGHEHELEAPWAQLEAAYDGQPGVTP